MTQFENWNNGWIAAPSQPVKRALTSVFGLLAIAGAVFSGFSLLRVWVQDPLPLSEQAGFFLFHMTLAFVAKSGLLCAGVAMLMRSRLALPLLTSAFILSSLDSLLILGWLLPPMPQGLSEAARAGRITGRFAAFALPGAFYIVVLSYLLLPRTRLEFGAQ